MMSDESHFVGHEPCPKCGSSNNLARYSDGHAHCFSLGCGYREPSDPTWETPMVPMMPGMRKDTWLPDHGTIGPLSVRKITSQTCQRWGYEQGEIDGAPVQLAWFRDPIKGAFAVKVRGKDKTFKTYGETRNLPLYGKWLWRTGGRRVIITEGEIDAMTVDQVMDYRWQVVSLPNGVSSAKATIARELEWLLTFEEVVLCFDQDEPGREAVKQVVGLFPAGRVKIVSLPLKDPNEMLVAGRTDELVRALWDAQAYRPDGIVTIKDIYERIVTAPAVGLPYFLPSLNETSFGRRWGECVALGAGTGVGKSTWITQQVAFDLDLGYSVAVFAFESSPAELVKRVAGIRKKKLFHVPDGAWTHEELTEAVDELEDLSAQLYLYDHFGACDWTVVKERIRYLHHSAGVRIFYIDHLTALAAAEDDERKALEKMMAEVSGLCQELGIWLLFVSHLATPEGKPHEEGGRVMIRHFKGSRSIGYWAHFMFGLERAQQADSEEERHTVTFRVLKDRFTGRGTGQVIALKYDHRTGLLGEADEVSFAPFETEEGHTF